MPDTRQHAHPAERPAPLAEADGSQRPFAHVLCAVDGTRPSYAAVEQAARLAGSHGSLTLLAVTAPRGSGRFRSAAIGSMRASRVMERAAAIAEQAGVPFTCVVDPGGPPAKVIEERAAEHDLLAIGAPSQSAFGTLGGSVAVDTLRTFTIPLLLARPEDGRSLTERIVVASDGSPGSDVLVALAARLPDERCEQIVLAHAQGSESQAHPHRMEAQMHLLESACGERASAEIEPRRDAAELIEKAVESHDATLAVLGSRRLSGLGALLGSVSRRAVRTLPCSVLVIPPERLAEGA